LGLVIEDLTRYSSIKNIKMRIFKILFSLSFLLTFNIILLSQNYDDYMSQEGVGLYFRNLIPNRAEMKLISKTELSSGFEYAGFYEDILNKKLYLKIWDKAININDLKDVDLKKNKNLNRIQYTEPEVIDESIKMESVSDMEDEKVSLEKSAAYHPFVKLSYLIPDLSVEIPQHHTIGNRLQSISGSRSGLDLDAVLYKLNSLGLKEYEQVNTKNGGFNILYDRLFINDEDESKFLVIWLNNDRIYANFLSNAGEWEFSEPKIVHKDIICHNKNGEIYSRDLSGTTDKSTLVTELNSIKYGDKYYIGYSLNSWESSPCFGGNLASCHISLLNSRLEVEKTVQIPSDFNNENEKRFASDLQMKMYMNNDTICAVIQSPNVGEDKLFVQCFDKNLGFMGSMMYLSCKSSTFSNLIPVVNVPNGFLITYKEIRKSTEDIYTQFIGNQNSAFKPLSVLSLAKSGNLRVVSTYMQKNSDNLDYYFVISDRSKGKTYLYQYQLTLVDYWTFLNYKIDADNWKSNKEIVEINTLVKQTEANIIQKRLNVYNLDFNEHVNKLVYVNKAFGIMKFTENYKDKNLQKNTSFYYDNDLNIRLAQFRLEETTEERTPVKRINYIQVYFNSDGKKIWEIRTDQDGKIYTDERDVRSVKFLYNYQINKPFDEFHRVKN